MSSKVEWHPENLDPLLKKVEKDFIRIGFQLESEIKKSMKGGAKEAGHAYIVTKAGRSAFRAGKTVQAKDIHYTSKKGDPPAVWTGRLRASITTNWTGSGKGRAEIKKSVKETQADDGIGQPPGAVVRSLRLGRKFVVVVGTNVEYGSALEFGRTDGSMAARPFLRPALEKFRPKMEQLMKKHK